MTNATNNTAPKAPVNTAPKAPAKAKGKPKAPAKRKAPAKGKAPAKAPVRKGKLAANLGLKTPTAAGKRRIGAGIEETMVVTLKSLENPKRYGSGAYGRYQVYIALNKKGAFTVGDLLAKGVQASDVRYNKTHGHITLKAPAKGKAKA